MITRIDTAARTKCYGDVTVFCNLYALLKGKWVNVKGYLHVENSNDTIVVINSLVELYPKTRVRWVRTFYPNTSDNFMFDGSWKDLCDLPESVRVLKQL